MGPLQINAFQWSSALAFVQVIEFESTALMIGHLGVRVSLIAYPVVSIKKAPYPPPLRLVDEPVYGGCAESCLVRTANGVTNRTSWA